MVQVQPRKIVHRPHLQNNQSKMDWRHGSSSRVTAFKHEGLSSNSSPTKKKKRERKERKEMKKNYFTNTIANIYT
jgi:hypothetical protein